MDNQHMCKNHPYSSAVVQCCVCGDWFCADCIAAGTAKDAKNRIISK